jgi:hypothetical protein
MIYIESVVSAIRYIIAKHGEILTKTTTCLRCIGTEGLEEKAWHAGVLQQINGDLLILVGHSVGQWSRSEVSVQVLCVGVSRVLKKDIHGKTHCFLPFIQ